MESEDLIAFVEDLAWLEFQGHNVAASLFHRWGTDIPSYYESRFLHVTDVTRRSRGGGDIRDIRQWIGYTPVFRNGTKL
jgi:hypothetical protein